MSTYIKDELRGSKDPQRKLDDYLMRRCIGGLTLYAAQLAQYNPESAKIAEIRSLIENLAGYWGLDGFSLDTLQKDFLMPVDFLTEMVKAGADLAHDPNEYAVDVVLGLYKHCEDLVTSQGIEAKGEIVAIGKLASVIAMERDLDIPDEHDFEPTMDGL